MDRIIERLTTQNAVDETFEVALAERERDWEEHVNRRRTFEAPKDDLNEKDQLMSRINGKQIIIFHFLTRFQIFFILG